MKPNQKITPDTAMPLTDVRLLELMASKICHDLISPVGAISNGVEILEELGADAGEDVTNLIAFSATQAAAKLKTLRLAYGQGGADSSIKPEDVHKTFGEFIHGDGRIKQDWNPNGPLGISEPTTGFAKILMCALLLVIEALPKGGKISVSEAGPNLTAVKGEGDNAGFREGFREALEQSIDPANLAPKQVHACLTGLLAQHYGFSITIDNTTPNTIILKISSPVV